MNKCFNNKDEPQTGGPTQEKMRYGERVFGMMKDIEVKFRKKKKEGNTIRKTKWDKIEEPPIIVPFKKSSFF
jgi:hypothetical protein